MGIGDKLNSLLKNRNRNINELATAINVSPQTLYSISKRNNTKVDLDILQKIADELAVTLDYFCTESRANNPAPVTSTLTLSDSEKKLVLAYREHPDMQPAINKMLDIAPAATGGIADDIIKELKKDASTFTKLKSNL